ncbi:MAG: adenylyltransferase/cytidyltransferase family protein [Candidatus Lokiarchaeota archaeon]|nr:adenylyltransferase/cytidyltransferase family protein [Candidatus Lokiarchaeota archaeon]
MTRKKVLAAGKFDILHLGHLAYLRQAKDLAGSDGTLVVIIARDDTIEKERGAPPVFPQEQRRKLVEALEMVDEAVIGYDNEDHSAIVIDIKPDIVALGYDQNANRVHLKESLNKAGLEVRIARLKKKKADGLCSSTKIRKRIIAYYKENGSIPGME